MMAGSPLGREIGSRVAVIVLAGVSGSGKSTIGEALAQKLEWPYAEADAFHPATNVAKMSAGISLTDEDRAPWLAKIAAFILDVCVRGQHAVVSCSALKHAYRTILVGAHPDKVRIVLLEGTEAEIAERLAGRTGHFMPPSLLHSQFATLERPTADERAIIVPVGDLKEEVVAHVIDALKH